ncbi:MAG: hypothetical protein ABIP35_05805 [Ginsengibacter sp.]
MKAVISLILFLRLTLFSFGQEKENLFILETDDSWKKELFHFPLSFAPDIHFTGIEDARFPKGWEDSLSNNFWSYVFAWEIENDMEPGKKELEENLKKYFDGLMGIKNTNVNFTKNQTLNDTILFTGTISTIDAFFTKRQMTLNVTAKICHCTHQKRSIILFKFSPKEFDNKIWFILEEATIRKNSCDP